MNIQDLTITTADGYQVAASLFIPKDKPKTTVIINSATGVLRQYYNAFALFLAEQGLQVISYDYRGIGGSKTNSTTDKALSMINWGREDYHAIVDWVESQYPEHKILGVGHSVGGQLLGLLPNNHRISAYLNVASQHAYWRNWRGKFKVQSFIFFHGLLPIFGFAAKQFPKWVLGSESLPKQATKDWSRFGRKAFYSDVDGSELKENYFKYQGKIRFLAIADDHAFAPLSAVKSLQENVYKNADSDFILIEPKHYGMKRIDHFGFFKKTMNQQAWHECAVWLNQQSSA
ncbi:MAG: alpha/beta fold hydrolase [Oleispira sp.]|nr:alpha/beta fold hydrolase [Oleispira sp.]MBL4882435.1 alpha/beta fold hydrolase [Oleispira sp.]